MDDEVLRTFTSLPPHIQHIAMSLAEDIAAAERTSGRQATNEELEMYARLLRELIESDGQTRGFGTGAVHH